MKNKYGYRAKPVAIALSLAGFLVQAQTAQAQTQEEFDAQNRFVVEVGYGFENPDFLSEQVDPWSGGLSINHEDLFLPGNGGLDLEINRHYVLPEKSFSHTAFPWFYANQGKYRMGFGWDIHFGYVTQPSWASQAGFNTHQAEVLGRNTSDPFSTCYREHNVFGNGANFDLIQFESMRLVSSNGNSELLANALSNAYSFATKSGWRGGCGATGFILYSPDGLKYTFDQAKYTAVSDRGSLSGPDYSWAWYVSKIEDQYGNWIAINYTSSNQALIDTVTTNDGRSVDFSYTTIGGHPSLTKITSQGQSVDYVYDTNRNLSQVTIGSRVIWSYTYQSFYEWYAASTIYLLKTLTTESGGVHEYEYAEAGRAFAGATRPLAVKRRITSGSIPASDTTYVYGTVAAGTYPLNQYGAIVSGFGKTHKTTRVREDDGTCTEYIFNDFDQGLWLVGTVARKSVYQDSTCISNTIANAPLVEREEYQWDRTKISDQGARRPLSVQFVGYIREVVDASYWKAVLREKTLTRDGDIYATTYNNFTEFGKPRTVVEANRLGETRTIDATYLSAPYQYALEPLSSATVKSQLGLVVSQSNITYDATYNPVTKSNNGLATNFTYHANGDLHTVTDGRGNTQTQTNYYRGIPGLISDSVGTKSQTIDYFGNITSQVDELNNSTAYSYTDFNRLAQHAPPLGAPVNYTYTNTSVVATHGNYIKTTMIDGYGRPLLITEQDVVQGLTKHQNIQYDAHNHTIFSSIPSESPIEATGTAYEYDQLDRLTQKNSPLGQNAYQYLLGGTIQRTDARGNQSTFVYGGYGAPDYSDIRNMQHALSSGDIITAIDKDEAGRIETVSQGGHAMEYLYHDTYRNLIKEQRYPQLTLYFEYDAAGNVTSKKVNGSDKTYFVYDTRNRLATTDYPSGTSDVDFSYYPTDLLHTAENGLGDWTYEYDTNSNMIARTLATDNKLYRFEFGYDTQNNVSNITYPNTLYVEYAPNAFGESTKAGTYANAVQHYAQGGIKSFTYGNGLTYDLLLSPNKVLIGEIIARSPTADVIRKSYLYDGETNVTDITDHIRPQYSVTQFNYDGINRLTQASSTSWSGTVAYAYDKTGNITSQTMPGETRSYTYDSTNQLTQVTGLSIQNFDYDLYANVRNNGNHSFIYNDAGQLISASDGNASKVYLYDALGKRIQVIDDAGNVEYEVYDDSDRLLLVEESDGTMRGKIYLGNNLISQDRDGSVKYMHFDTLGSTIAVSNTSGQLELEHYWPYGEKVESPAGTDNDQWYTGKRFDYDISLSYYGARYFDPAIGRFYANDPSGYRDVYSFNRYAYANNNPYKYNDPDGRDVVSANPANNAQLQTYINTRARGLFEFDSSNKLRKIRTSGASGYSEKYRDRLVSAITDADTITLDISSTHTDSTGKVWNVDTEAGGGLTEGRKSGGTQTVVVSGNPNTTLKNTSGAPLRDDPADILVHELVGHAIPHTVGTDTGNAVDNENKVRTEVTGGDQRQLDPRHRE